MCGIIICAFFPFFGGVNFRSEYFGRVLKAALGKIEFLNTGGSEKGIFALEEVSEEIGGKS